MRWIIFCILLSFCTQIQGQTYHIYEIETDGSTGKLLRIETYQNGHLTQSDNFQPNGKIAFTLTQTYENDLLTRQVKTMKIDHEFDLIREYTYDFEGRKIGELFGNNRTGKWGSFRFIYNPQGDLETASVHKKNGDLDRRGKYIYTYDEQGRKTSEIRQDVKLETGAISDGNRFVYEYLDEKKQVKTTEKDASGKVIFTETVTYISDDKPTKRTLQMEGFAPTTIKYFYEKNKCTKEEEYRDGKRRMTTTYQYFLDGRMKEKKYRYANGNYGGERWVSMSK